MDFLDELRSEFYGEVEELLVSFQDSLTHLRTDFDPEYLKQIFRILHNLKGTSQSVELAHFSSCVHKVEDFVQTLKEEQSLKCLNEGQLKYLWSAYDLIESGVKGLIEGQIETDCFILSEYESLNDCLEESPVEGEDTKNTLEVATIEREDQTEEKNDISPGSVSNLPKKSNSAQFVKCPVSKVETMLNFLGETITLVNQINSDCTDDLERNRQSITKYINELYLSCLSLTSVEVKRVVPKLDRVVREACAKVGKEVDFICTGDYLEIDKFILESLTDPLVHILRNAIDHGIERPEDRLVIGKEPKGTLKLKIEKSADRISIIVQDDGGGIDPEKIYTIAKSKGLTSLESQRLSKNEKLSFILAPGFSTKETITDLSGRGVGMDVVAKSVQELRGEIRIESEISKGSRFIINIPTSMKIYHGLIAQAWNQRFVLRSTDIHMIHRCSLDELTLVKKGIYHFVHNKQIFEIADLGNIFFNQSLIEAASDGSQIIGTIVLCKFQGKNFGLLFNEVSSREKLVEKDIQFRQDFLNIKIDDSFFTGISVLPDGKIGSIIHIPSFYKRVFNSEAA
jgi:two-component system chemotaxis sensor kinase CheA